jgi:nuclear cap-binding protein subunit 2
MAELYHKEEEPQYITLDRKNYISGEEQIEALKKSSTVYVGNLSFFSKEIQIYETFGRIGPIKRLIMGLNSFDKTPCGFCFIEYHIQEHAHMALKYISDSVCDDRIIRCDADPGFLPGRQYGRGKSGGQIRDEWKNDYDPGRGRFTLPSMTGKRKGRDDDDDEDGGRGRDRGGRGKGRTVWAPRNFTGRPRMERRHSGGSHGSSGYRYAAHRRVQDATKALNSGLHASRF